MYRLTVRDINQCIATHDYSILDLATSVFVVNVSSTNVGCANASTGSIEIYAAGGNKSYSYLWGSGETTSTRANLSAGIYPVTVSDAVGCAKQFTIAITEPSTYSRLYFLLYYLLIGLFVEGELCQNNGTCAGLNQCTCKGYWSGPNCTTRTFLYFLFFYLIILID